MDKGEITRIEGGGYYGDMWREVLDLAKDIQYPGFPRPGTGWIVELAIGTNPKIIGPTEVEELKGGHLRNRQIVGVVEDEVLADIVIGEPTIELAVIEERILVAIAQIFLIEYPGGIIDALGETRSSATTSAAVLWSGLDDPRLIYRMPGVGGLCGLSRRSYEADSRRWEHTQRRKPRPFTRANPLLMAMIVPSSSV